MMTVGSSGWWGTSCALMIALTAARALAVGPDSEKREPGIYLATKNADGQEELTRLHSSRAQEVQTALNLDSDVPVLLCDARSRESGKEVLITMVEHAMRAAATQRATDVAAL